MGILHKFINNKFLVVLPILFWLGACHAENKKYFPNEPLSDEFLSGEYLIYDCERGHFACISRVNFEFCQKRFESSKGPSSQFLFCRPLQQYQDLEECLKNQQRLVNQSRAGDLCRNYKLATDSK